MPGTESTIGGAKKYVKADLSPCGSVSAEVVEAVQRVLDDGRLYRYDFKSHEGCEVSLMEEEIADYTGAKFAIGVNSCSSAIFMALKCAGVEHGDKVLMPAFTFTAVPSAIVHAGAEPVLVEVTENYNIDMDDLRRKITDETRVLLLSHMRGQVCDMDEVVDICEEHGIFLIEDSAHSLGMTWKGRHSGTIGRIGCYSTQSYKLIDAGEGGIFVTDDEEIAAKAIIYAGAYEKKWKSHKLRPGLLAELSGTLPCYNFRMNNLTAAVIRAQIPLLPERLKNLNEKYDRLSEILDESEHIRLPDRDPRLTLAADSIQFNLVGLTEDERDTFLQRCNDAGVPVSVFGGNTGNARCYWNWKYLGDVGEHPQTRDILAFACDMRLPERLQMEDIEDVGEVILDVMASIKGSA